MPNYQPPFQLTTKILSLVADISEQLGAWSARSDETLTPMLRRGNRIRTVQASLEIEHNTLTVEQVTAVLEGKAVLGLPREIQEVRNAFAAYDGLLTWQPFKALDLLAAHKLLMLNLVDDAGCYRGADVGIYRDDQLIHRAPPVSQLNRLMVDLMDWLHHTDAHPLIASCVFHYEFEFIHPFADGNGRMGRLWQTLILSRWRPELIYLPVETVIRDKQADYYAALRAADKASDSTVFVEFMLEALQLALTQALGKTAAKETTRKTTAKTTAKTTRKALTKTVDLLLDCLSARPEMTIPQLAGELGLTDDGVRYHLKKLKAAGKVERIGGRKEGYWQIIDG